MVQTLCLNGGSNQQRLDGKWRGERESSKEYVSSTSSSPGRQHAPPSAIRMCTAGKVSLGNRIDRQVSCILLAVRTSAAAVCETVTCTRY